MRSPRLAERYGIIGDLKNRAVADSVIGSSVALYFAAAPAAGVFVDRLRDRRSARFFARRSGGSGDRRWWCTPLFGQLTAARRPVFFPVPCVPGRLPRESRAGGVPMFPAALYPGRGGGIFLPAFFRRRDRPAMMSDPTKLLRAAWA